jgi:hypothetical protein
LRKKIGGGKNESMVKLFSSIYNGGSNEFVNGLRYGSFDFGTGQAKLPANAR